LPRARSIFVTANSSDNLSGIDGYLFEASTAADFSGTLIRTDWGTAVSTDIAGLSANTTYAFRVNAKNNYGNETGFLVVSESVTWARNPAFSAEPYADVWITSMTVAWDANTNGFGTLYDVALSTDPAYPNAHTGTVELTTRPYAGPDALFTSLDSNTTYFLFVRSVSHSGIPSPFIAMGSTSTLAIVPAAAPPTYLEVHQSSAIVQWSPNGNAVNKTSYSVVMTTGTMFPNGFPENISLATAAAGAVPSATLTGLKANATYYLHVAAYNHSGRVTPYAALGSTVTRAFIPAAAPGTYAGVYPTSMTVNWDSNGNVEGTLYETVLTTGSVFPNAYADNVYVATAPEGALSADFIGLSLNSTYYLHIRAVARDGTPTSYVAFGSTSTLSAIPGAHLSGSTFGVVNENDLSGQWDANGNPPVRTEYEAVLSTGGTFPNVHSGNRVSVGPAVGAAFGTLDANTTYYLFVRARNNNWVWTDYAALGSTSTLANAPSSAVSTYSALGLASVEVSWDRNSNPVDHTSYTVILSTDTPLVRTYTGNVSIDTAPAGAAPQATFSGLDWNTTYYLFVEAVNHNGVRSVKLPLGSTVTLAGEPLGVFPAFTDVLATGVTAHWDRRSNPLSLSRYEIAATTGAVFPNAFSGNVAFTTAPSAVGEAAVAGLAVNTTYQVFVRVLPNGAYETGYLFLGSTSTLVNPPVAAGTPFPWVTQSSMTAQWDVNGNPLDRTTFTVVLATGLPVNAESALTRVVSTVAAFGTMAHEYGALWGNASYFLLVEAVNHNGVGSGYIQVGATRTPVSPPLYGRLGGVSPYRIDADWYGARNTGGERYFASGGGPGILPGERRGHAMVVYNDTLIVAGGLDSAGNVSSDVWKAKVGGDGSLGPWTATTSLPEARESLSLAVWGGRLYALGGFEGTVRPTVWWAPLGQDGSVGLWRETLSLPEGRYRGAAAAIEDTLFFFGGDNGIIGQNAVFRAPIFTDGSVGPWDQATAALPQALSGHAVAVSSGRVYVSGGVGLAGLSASIYRAEPGDGDIAAWDTEAQSLPEGLFQHAAAASRSWLYVVGGHDGVEVSSRSYAAEISTAGGLGSFRPFKDVPRTFQHALVIHRDRLFMTGGSDASSVYDSVLPGRLAGTEYLVDWAEDAGFSVGYASSGWRSGLDYELTGLTPNTTYFARVRARALDGTETVVLPLGSTVTLAAAPASTSPAFSGIWTTSVTVRWLANGNPGSTEYQVDAATSADFGGTLVSGPWGAGLSAPVTGLAVNTSYYYRARSRAGSGVGSPYESLGSTFTLGAVPSGSTFTAVDTIGFTMEWSPNNSPAGTWYEAQVGTEPAFGTVSASSVTLSTSASFTNLLSASTFYARVRSLNGNWMPSGFDSVISTWTRLDTDPPGVSTGTLAYQTGTSDRLMLRWVLPGDDGYAGDLLVGSSFYIQWSTDAPSSVSWSTASAQVTAATGPVTPGNTAYYELAGLPAGKEVYFRLWTGDERGNLSQPSPVFSGYTSLFVRETVDDGAPSVGGERLAAAADRSGNLHVVYREDGTGNLLYAKRTGSIWGLPQTVDTGGDFGVYASLVVGADGLPRAAYSRQSDALLYAAFDGTAWSTAAVASGAGMGVWPSLALDGAGQPHIAYHDAAGLDLEYAVYDSSAGAWALSTVDAAGSSGRHPSLALDSAGEPHIAYVVDGNVLKYARRTAGSWGFESPDSGGSLAYPSLALDGNGLARIAFEETGSGELRFASFDGSSWSRVVVDTSSAAGETSLALDGDGWAHIAYRDSAVGDLKNADFDGAAWSTGTVDSEGATGKAPSIVLDAGGGTHILYYDEDRGYLRAALRSTSFSAPMGGSPRGSLQSPSDMAGAPASSTTVQWRWVDNAANELGFRLYYSESSSGPFTLAAGTSTVGAAAGVGTMVTYLQTGLSTDTSYFAYATAVNAGGTAVSSSAVVFTFDTVDRSSPTIIVNLTGDETWRGSNNGTYDVDLLDIGGGGLDDLQVKASTVPAGAGSDLIGFQDAVVGIGSDTYSADWSLPAAVFDALLEEATNYISLRVTDGVGNAAVFTDVFYVKKDTTPPTVAVNQTGDDTVRASSGTAYDVDARDSVSRLATFQYSVSATPGAGDASLLAWTDAAGVSGSSAHTANWTVDFEGLVSGTTNYVSVRAVDAAGISSTVVDAFHIVKDTDGPDVAITAPLELVRSTADVIYGTASDWNLVTGVEVSIKKVFPITAAPYWGGAGFNSGGEVWLPAGGTTSWALAHGIAFASSETYRVVARSSDSLANYSSVYATWTFTFDARPPQIGVVAPAGGATVTSLPAISGTAGDRQPDAGVSSASLRLMRLTDGAYWDFDSEHWSSTATAISTPALLTSTWTWTWAVPDIVAASLAHETSYYAAVRAADLAVPANAGDYFASGATFTFVDPGPPDAVADLTGFYGEEPGDLLLSWTAPGDDGASGMLGTGEYRVQYIVFSSATTPTDADFSTAAAQVSFSTGRVAAGSLQTHVVTKDGDGLVPGTTYWVRLWLADDAGNWNSLSNGVTAYARPNPSYAIRGVVVNRSSVPIQAVWIDCWDSAGNKMGETVYSNASGSFTVTDLAAGDFMLRATYIVEDVESSITQDKVPMGIVDADFGLDIDLTLGGLTGTMLTLAAETGATQGFSVTAAKDNFKASRIELFQKGRNVAQAEVLPSGRWNITNLLPGKYGIRAFNGQEYTPVMDVELLEGETQEVSFFYDPLPEADVFAFPNPARRETTFRFRSPLAPLEAQIVVFDIAGNLVRELAGSEMTSPEPMLYHASWDLTNMRGEGVASGVYLFMVKVKGANGQRAKVIKKLAVVK